MKAIGERLAGTAGRAGLENVREVGERLAKSDRPLDASGTDLLDYAQSVVGGLKDTTGRGDPDSGEVFGQAQSTFDAVSQTLKSAAPVGWDGSGSYAYADQNARQQLRFEAMADADHTVHNVLRREAAQIALRRRYLNDQYDFLADASQVTFPLQFVPRYGQAMQLAVEIAAVQTSLGESRHQVSELQAEVSQNAAELQQTVGRYAGVADGAELPDDAMSFAAGQPADSLPIDIDPESDRLQTGVAARLYLDKPPGPPAGTPLQDGR